MNILQKFYIQKPLDRNSFKFKFTMILGLVVILILMSLLSVFYGSVKLNIKDIFNAFINGDNISKTYIIIFYVRIPRIIAGILAGAALAVSGVILQAVLNNALASPNIIGVNSGAGLFTIMLVVFFPEYINYVPLAAFLGALFASLLIYFIAYKTGVSRGTIVLAGIAVSSFLNAGIQTIMTLYPEASIGNNSFMVGGFSGITMNKIKFAIGYIIVGLILAYILSYHMNILALGDEIATSLGLKVSFYRFLLIIVASILAGSAISFSGLLGFVGLIIPHFTRLIMGTDNRLVIPVSSIMGGIFVVTCDLISRVIFSPFEIPVGIIMSFIGGPFFIYILIKQKKRLNI